MKRLTLLLTLILTLLLAGQGFAAGPYYIDKRLYGMNRLTSNGTNVSPNDTVTVGAKTYTFVAALTPTEGQILIGGTYDVSFQNFIDAINHTGTPGTQYSCAAQNSNISAGAYQSSIKSTDVTARVPGGLGCVATTKSAATLTWYKTVLIGGNGTTTAQCTIPGSTGAFVAFTQANDNNYVANSTTATINVVAGSGPYYPSDAQYAAVGYIYPGQGGTNTVTWNFNGEAFQADFNVNTASYSWVLGTGTGATWWGLVDADGTSRAQRPTTHGGGNFVLTNSVIIGDHIYGDWNDTAVNLINGAVSYKPNNWAWGDYNSRGYSTLYVKTANGLSPADPSNAGMGVWVCQQTNCFRTTVGYEPHIVNNMVISGSNDLTTGAINLNTAFTEYGGVIANCATCGIYLSTGGILTADYTKFVNCGHRGVSCSAQVNYSIYNCYFDRCHLAVYDSSATSHTVTYTNNSTHNLYAGGVELVSNATFTETNNQWHIDSNSSHGGKALSFGGLTNWPTTAASDFPPSTDTSTATSVDPIVLTGTSFVKVGKPLIKQSPLYQTGTNVSLATDFDGVAVGNPPNIGVYEGYMYSGSSPMGLGPSGWNFSGKRVQ